MANGEIGSLRPAGGRRSMQHCSDYPVRLLRNRPPETVFSRGPPLPSVAAPRTLALASPHPGCIAMRACRVACAAVCRIRPGRWAGSAQRPARPAATDPLPGAVCRAPGRQAAHLRGPAEPPAARRHLVLPPGRRLRGRLRALVCPARPGRVAGDPRPAQLERAGHAAQQGLRWLVSQGVHAPGLAEEGKALLEGALRGLQLPHQGVAQRQDDRRLHRLLPVRGRSGRPAQGTQHAGRQGLLAAQQHRPDALAPRRVQRVRNGWLVELRRPPA